MPGSVLLAGGGEFGGRMVIPDRQAIALAGGPQAPVAIIPAAAAPDHNDRRAGQKAVDWFQRLGSRRAESLPLVDRPSADDTAIASRLQNARLIYLLGGFPGHLAQALKESLSWRAMLQAYRSGAVIAGSSAGAMVLCSDFFDPAQKAVRIGLGLLPKTCVLPHHDTGGQRWLARLQAALPDHLLMGIDEETAALRIGDEKRWQVWGKGKVTLYRRADTAVFGPERPFDLAQWT